MRVMTMTDDMPNLSPDRYAAVAWQYRSAGWLGVLPLPVGQKGPVPVGWTGTTGGWPSGSDIQAWTEDEPDGNVALRLPEGVIGVDVDAYDAKPGRYVLADLEQKLGALPATWRVTSRDDGCSGIRLYRVTPGLRWPGILGPGIEVIRTGHRYAVVWPSLHPDTGATYRWIAPDGTSVIGPIPNVDELPDLPERWVEHFTHGEQATDQGRADLTGSAAAAWLDERTGIPPCPHMQTALTRGLEDIEIARGGGSARHDAALRVTNRIIWLAGEGHAGVDVALQTTRRAFQAAVAGSRDPHEADAEWARLVDGAVRVAAHAWPQPFDDPCFHNPLVPKENPWPPSASPSPSPSPSPSDTRSPSSPGSPTPSNGSPVPSSQAGPDPSGWTTSATPATAPDETSTSRQASPAAPATAGNAAAPASSPERTSWWPRDLEPALTGERTEPPPAYLARLDGCCAFYPNRVNGLIGPSESGKTWVALHAVAIALAAGERVTYLDFEDSREGIIGRLLAIGTSPEQIREQFAYINPDEPFSIYAQTGIDLAEHFAEWQPGLVVLDGYNAAITAQGLDLMSNKDVTTFTRAVLKPIARNDRCLVYIDHVAKSKENVSAGGIGAQAKRADTSGATIRVDVIRMFGKGQTGKLRLFVDKDRQGEVRGISAAGKSGHWFGDIEIVSHVDGPVEITLTVPDGLDVEAREYEPPRLTGYMERISAWLVDNPGATLNEVVEGVGGNKKHVSSAMRDLVAEGYVTVEIGPRRSHLHTLDHPFYETSDLVPTGSDPTGSALVPTGSEEPVSLTGSTGSTHPYEVGCGPEPVEPPSPPRSVADRFRASLGQGTMPEADVTGREHE